MMINLAEKEYQIDIRKNLPIEQLTTSAEKKKNFNILLWIVWDQ